MDEADDFGDLYAGLDPVAGDNSPAAGDPAAMTTAAAETAKGEAESSDSDSEDDLRIVLNDGDAKEFPRVGSGSAAAAVWDEEEEGGEIPAVNAGEPAPPAERMTPAAATPKSGYRNWHVTPQSGAYPNTARISTFGRGDRDHLMMPCSGGTVSFKSGVPTPANFCLPRYRTIFDIDIEKFAEKPWKHHGADVTDYFNFDLDEDSWKSYCRSMDLCRRQPTMIRFPFYESSRPNQAFKSEVVLNKPLLSEACVGPGERSIINENVGGLELPQGRAIEVDVGFGERIPTADLRRPSRLRYSDVVIQISMEGSMMDASGLCEEELKHVEDIHIDGSVLDSDNDLNKSSSVDHVEHRSAKETGTLEHNYREKLAISRDNTAEVTTRIKCTNDDEVSPLKPRSSASRLADDSASSYQFLHSSSPSVLESRSVASKNGGSLENRSPCKKTSESSVSGLNESIKPDHYPSNGSRNDATKLEDELSEHSVSDHSLSMTDRKISRRTRLQGKAELMITDSKDDSGIGHKKHHHVSYSTELGYHARTRNHDYEIGRDFLPSYEEAELSHGYKHKRNVERHDGAKTYARHYNNKDNHDVSIWRDHEERMHLHKERPRPCSEMKHAESNFYGRHRDDYVLGDVVREEWDQPISGHKSLLRGKSSYLWQKRERNNMKRIWHEDEYDDSVFEERYEADYLEELHLSHRPYCDMNDGAFYHKFGRNESRSTRELRSPERRYKYDSDSCFDLNRTSRFDENCAKNEKYPDQRFLDSQEYPESPIADDRYWHGASSPTNHLPLSLRLNENLADHRNNTREMRYKNMENERYSVPSSDDHHHSSKYRSLTFVNDDCSIEERDLHVDKIVCNVNRRFNRLAKPRHCTNHIEYRQQECDMFSLKAHETDHVSYHDRDQKYYDNHLFSHIANKRITERSSSSDSRDRITSVKNIYDKGRNDLADIEWMESANVHVNGWKGKFLQRSNEPACKRSFVGCSEEISKKKKVPAHEELMDRGSARPTGTQLERVGEFRSEVSENLNTNDAIQQDADDDEIEEGQLIEEPDEQNVFSNSATKIWPDSVEEKIRQSKESVCNNKTIGGYDSNRIRETLAKMEKRRERFKEPIGPTSEKTQMPVLDVAAETELVQQQRPARKRRWVVS